MSTQAKRGRTGHEIGCRVVAIRDSDEAAPFALPVEVRVALTDEGEADGFDIIAADEKYVAMATTRKRADFIADCINTRAPAVTVWDTAVENYPRERHGWQLHRGVTCVECPSCAFTFDAEHTDEPDGESYSCPNCLYDADHGQARASTPDSRPPAREDAGEEPESSTAPSEGSARPLPIVRHGYYFEHPVAFACDANCRKAWGINSRPKVQFSDDPDDYAFLTDAELGDAPDDPGTYEGGHGKPTHPDDRLNKWCVRECERSVIVGTEAGVGALPDFSTRYRNLPADEGGGPDLPSPPTETGTEQ